MDQAMSCCDSELVLNVSVFCIFVKAPLLVNQAITIPVLPNT